MVEAEVVAGMPGISAAPSEPPAPSAPAEPPSVGSAGVWVGRPEALAVPEPLGVANGCGTVPGRVAEGDGAAAGGWDTEVDGCGALDGDVDGAGAVARADGDAVGAVRPGEVALAAGLGLACRWVALARGWAVARGWLAGWDWVDPCGWDLGLAAAAGVLADGTLAELAEASKR